MNKLILSLLCMAVATSVYARPTTKKKVRAPVAVAAFATVSYLIADNQGFVLQEHDSDLQRPIASISKLMVSLLAANQDLDESLDIPLRREVQSGIPGRVRTLTRKELLTLALVKSDNFAAQILCTNIPDCVQSMNAKAIELGMVQTHYEEPTGLSKENVSTAKDLLKLMLVAATNQTITSISSLPKAEIPAGKLTMKLHNTNPLTAKLDVFLSKTGFTNPAGGCLVMAVNSPIGQRFLVLLGSRNAHTRIPAMEKLYKEML